MLSEPALPAAPDSMQEYNGIATDSNAWQGNTTCFIPEAALAVLSQASQELSQLCTGKHDVRIYRTCYFSNMSVSYIVKMQECCAFKRVLEHQYWNYWMRCFS